MPGGGVIVWKSNSIRGDDISSFYNGRTVCRFYLSPVHSWTRSNLTSSLPRLLEASSCWFERLILQIAFEYAQTWDVELCTLATHDSAKVCMVLINLDGKDHMSIDVINQQGKSAPTLLGLSTMFMQQLQISKRVQGLNWFATKESDDQAKQRLRTAEKWVHGCTQAHYSCRKSVAVDPFLPYRVLNLEEVEAKDMMRLVLSNGRRGRYIALSYCWGSVDEHPPKTERANLEARMKGMRSSSMPKTFQEAITLSRALKIQYLWIDALCIVQDDEREWHSEAEKMCAVYENSFVTIAATNARDCKEGFLQPTSFAQEREYQVV